MTRRRALILLSVLVIVLVAVPVAGATSDLYANLGPGGSTSPAVDRYPLGNYVLDSHFSAIKASLTHFDATGVPSMIAYFLANLLWQITAFCMNAMISLFALAFSVDLLNGSPATAGAGALAPVSDAIHNLYANTLGEPWMEIAVLLAGCWAMWRALIQRRYTETASAMAMSLIFCVLALAIVTKPDATIGPASRWTNEISAAFLSVSSHGEVRSGPAARRAVSDQLFETLVFRPWVALQFGGTEHCIRKGTGSKQHDPESVPVRPLATDPHQDAQARRRLRQAGHLVTATKECVDNTVRYPSHFLRYAPGSEDRDAAYDAANTADPDKVPDTDPTKNTYKPAVVDKPATDAMEKGGQYQRLLLALVILVGELGALLLLGSLSVSVLMSAMVVLLLAGFSPVALVAAIIPGRGHQLFKTWAGQLATHLIRKAAYSLILAVLLAVLAALQDATTNLGWLLSFAMQSMLMWMVFLHRNQLAGQLIAAVSGQQPAREAQLRKLLGVAYLARQINPARRRPTRPRPGSSQDAYGQDDDGPDPGQNPPEDQQPPTDQDTPPSVTESRPPVVATHGRPSARRDHGGARAAHHETQPLARRGHRASSAPRPRRSPYTKTEVDLYRNHDGHEVWRVSASDGSLIAEDVASDRDMTWLRDYHEHEHLGDVEATAAADQLKYQDEAEAEAVRGAHRADGGTPPPTGRSRRPGSSAPRRERPPYTKTELDLVHADGHQVWRVLAPDGSVLGDDIVSDRDMTWLRDYHEHEHLGDTEARAIADQLKDQDIADAQAVRNVHRAAEAARQRKNEDEEPRA